MIRRHHLIEEAKAELDVAYEEVKRAEQEIMGLEYTYNEKFTTFEPSQQRNGTVAALTAEKEELQSKIDISSLYDLQKTAVGRFAMVSSAFILVGTVDDPAMCADLLRQVLFREKEIRGRKVGIDGMIRTFVKGLRAYSTEDSSPGLDNNVRMAWAEIEAILRELGRDI